MRERFDGTGDVDRASCLFFEGAAGSSRGVYRPTGYALHLTAGTVDGQHLTHLHEIHHKALNDDTAWGVALHVSARHLAWSAELFPSLLAACRTVHEVYASFMSMTLASARHDTIDAAMAAYPDYGRYAARMRRLLRGVPGGHRLDLAAAGVARFCMSGPVLERMMQAYPAPLRLSALRGIDRPDVRFALCQTSPAAVVPAAVLAADEAFHAHAGATVEEVGLDAGDAALDDGWRVWEDVFTAALVAAHPRMRHLAAPAHDTHLAEAIALAALVAADGIDLDLPMGSMDDRPTTDPESTQRLLSAVSIPLRTEPWPGVLATVGEQVDPSDLAALLAVTTGAKPHLEVFATPAAALLDDYRFPPQDVEYLGEVQSAPVFAVRALIDDDGRDTILHAVLQSPADLETVVAEWVGRGPVTHCITSSCFAAAGWQERWGPTLRSAPTIVLVDSGVLGMVGIDRLLGANEPVWGSYVDLGHGFLRGLVWHVDTHPHVMLAIGDDLTIQLIAGQLADLLGDRLRMHDSDWSAWNGALGATTATLLATTTVMRFAGQRRPE